MGRTVPPIKWVPGSPSPCGQMAEAWEWPLISLCLVARTERQEAAPSTFLYASKRFRGLRKDKIAIYSSLLPYCQSKLNVQHVLKFNAGITIAELSTLLSMN